MTGNPQAVYTHGHHESVLRAHRRRTAENSAGYLLPHLRPGISVLDVGCGPGTITVDLAARVAPGQVTAVELTDDALDLARAEARARGQANIVFATSDVHALDFADDTFDVVHAHQVLQHVADPVQALRELRRVCKPGGVVAVRDADYAGFTWFPQLPGAGPLDAALRRGGAGQRRRARRGAAAVVVGSARRTATTSRPPAACGVLRRRKTATGGAGCGRTGSSSRPWLVSWSTQGWRQPRSSEEISSAWRDWAAAPDGWLAIPHGEILCRA